MSSRVFRGGLGKRWLAMLAALAAPALLPAAGDSPAAWERVVALDAGPQTKFTSREEARAGSLGHLAKQEKALREFLTAYPGDEHGFEARLRLARVLQVRASFAGSEAPSPEARQILDELDRSATATQRPEVDFARLAYLMRTLRMSSGSEREQLLAATNRFRNDNPNDRRLAALLEEVAGLFDHEPELKRSLLVQAQAAAKEPALQQQIADDLRRLDFLGQPVSLKLPTRSGKSLDLAEYRGKVVVLVFMAEFSQPAVEAVETIQRAAHEWPRGSVQIVGVSVDSKPEAVAAMIQRENIAWPIGFDGKGWASPALRTLGINRLPSVWLLDQTGVLRSLSGLDSITDQVRGLLKPR